MYRFYLLITLTNLFLFQIYYRIHAGALKLLEKYDNQSSNEELYTKIKKALDLISNMPPIADKNK